MITAEELPDTEQSNLYRLIAARPRPEDIDLEVLTELQSKASRLPHATHEFINWLLPMADGLKEQLDEAVKRHMSEFRDAGHGRLTEAFAQMTAAMELYAEFLSRRRILNANGLGVFEDWYTRGIRDLVRSQKNSSEGADPVKLFVETLEDLIDTNKVQLGSKARSKGNSRSKAPLIGWKHQDGRLLLKKSPTMAEVKKALRDAGDGLHVAPKEIWRRLLEAGHLEPSNDGKRPDEHREEIGGKRVRVARFRFDLDNAAQNTLSPGDRPSLAQCSTDAPWDRNVLFVDDSDG